MTCSVGSGIGIMGVALAASISFFGYKASSTFGSEAQEFRQLTKNALDNVPVVVRATTHLLDDASAAVKAGTKILTNIGNITLTKSLADKFAEHLKPFTNHLNNELEKGIENAANKLDEKVLETGSKIQSMFTSTSKTIGGITIGFLVMQVAIRLLSAYAEVYLKMYFGRPKLALEYQFESKQNRLTKLVMPHIGSALKIIFGEPPKDKPIDRPIFKKEIQAQLAKVEKMAKNTHKNGGYFSHLLLYGPPGTGKTMVSKVIAKEAGTNYFMISGGQLSQFIKRGEHISELNKLFERANHGSEKPTIIFIDEAEGLMKKRDKLSMERVDLLDTFLNHTGEASKKFMLILATNRPEDLDSAVLSRMDYQIEIGPPEPSERLQILKMNLTKFFEEDPIFTEDYIESLNERLTDLTGRDIFKLCNMMATAKSTSEDNTLTLELIEETLKQFISNRARIQKNIISK